MLNRWLTLFLLPTFVTALIPLQLLSQELKVNPPPASPLGANSLAPGCMREIVETILQNHIHAPPRAQLLADIMKNLSVVSGNEAGGTTETLDYQSQNLDQLYSQVELELKRLQLYTAPNGLTWLNSAIAKSVPGSATLVSKKEAEVQKQLDANRYVGIGVRVTTHSDGWMLINESIEGGTAAAAGIGENEIVERIDGQSTKGLPLANLVQMLRGVEGSQVTLEVRSSSGSATRTVTLTRAVVPIKTVQFYLGTKYDFRAEVATLELKRIAASNVAELSQQIEQLPASVTTILLDLTGLSAKAFELHQDVSPSNHHYYVLLADALLDACPLGSVETRTSRRKLESESGTILNGRRLVVLCPPMLTGYLEWLAVNLHLQGVRILFDTPPIESTLTDIYLGYDNCEVTDDLSLNLLMTGLKLPEPRPTKPIGSQVNSIRDIMDPP